VRGTARGVAILATATLAAFLSGGPAAGEVDSKKDRFSEALARAQADLLTSEGRAYDVALSGYFARQNGPVLGACFRSNPNADKTSFEIAFRLAKDGTVREALVWPETAIGACVRDDLRTKTLPPPPKDGHWADLRVNFRK